MRVDKYETEIRNGEYPALKNKAIVLNTVHLVLLRRKDNMIFWEPSM